MDGPWSDYGSGDTATATAPADEQGPWTQFEPGVAAPVQAPDLSKIKLSAYDQATVDRGGIKPPSGMESGTELLTAVGSSPVGRAAIAGGEALGGQISDTAKWLGDAYLNMQGGRDPMAGIETLTQPVARAAGYQLGEAGRALWRPVGELAGESDWDELSKQYPKLMAVPKVVKGMVESAPKMAAQTLLGPEIGPAVWGLTDEGFDAKTAATMYALPWVKNYTGAIAESVASKMGINNELAKQVVNRVAGGTAMAGVLTGEQIDELRKLSPEERAKKAPETIGNALAMFAMGTLERGRMPKKPAKVTPMTGEALDMPKGSKPHPQQALLDDIIQEGVKRSDAEALISGTKTVKQVVDDNMDIVTPSRDFSRVAASPDSSFGHADAMIEGYTMAIARLEKILGLDKVKKPEPPVVPTAPTARAPMTQEEHASVYPVIKSDALVDGREQLNPDRVPNMSSIESSIDNPQILPGIREVPMSDFTLTGKHYSVEGQKKIDALAESIKDSGKISPLIVVRDSEGAYILEGATRADALFKLGAKSFPAKVVLDIGDIEKTKAPVVPTKAEATAHPAVALEKALDDPTTQTGDRKRLVTQTGLAMSNIEDLEKLVSLREKYVNTAGDKAAKTEDRFAAPFNGQSAREALEVATDSGSQIEAEIKPGLPKLGDRPLDWKKNPEVAKWFQDNAERLEKLGFQIPDELKAPKPAAPPPAAAPEKAAAGPEQRALLEVPTTPKARSQQIDILRRYDAALERQEQNAPTDTTIDKYNAWRDKRTEIQSKLKELESAAMKEAKAQTPEPKPAAPEKGMAGPGTPSAAQGPDVGGGFQNQSGADIYGIAQRVRQQRAKAGQVSPIPTGQGVAAGEAVKWGQDLISMGVDPEKSMQEFERTRAVSFDLMAMGRGHGESLAKTARSIEGKFGTDSNEYRMAQKALTDWDTRSKAMQTEWHKIGMAQQGETDIDTGSFTGISRAFKDATGQDFTPGQKQRATKIAAQVSSADKAAQSAKPNLQATIDKIGAPVEPRVQRLAEKIIAAMDKKANDALARIKARQTQGRAFSVGDPEDFDDVIIYGAAKITKGVVEFGVWSHEMLAEIGKGIEPHLRKIFDAATKYEDDETTRLAGGKSQQQKVKSASKTPKVPTDIAEQKKAFQDYKPGAPMDPAQLKTLWTRAMEYIKPDGNDMADVVYKTSEDLGISAKDVLKGLNQSRSVKRVADDVWQKQRQARILKQSAKQWIEHAQETWLAKALPASARALFSAKVGLHGTVALGTHASLVAATHPVIFAQNFGKMHKLVASPEYYQMQIKALARRPNYNTAQRAGLVNDMAKMEDFNDPRLALQHPKLSAWFKKNLDKVHLGRLVGMGTRGYSVLKVLRQDLFDHEWDKLAESKQTPDMAKAIADSVNHITGVDAAKLPSVANYALFAPKLALSRIKVIAGDPLRAVNSLLKMRDMTDAEKWFATNQFKEKAKIFGTATGLLIANQQLNSLFGDDKKLNGVPAALGGAGFNPMASDFMKFRVAGMNVAWGSPFLTMSRLPLRLVQIGMSNGGKSRFLIYPDESMYKTTGSYLRTQESPFMAPIVSLLTKADWQDRPLPQIPGYGSPPPMPKRLAAQGIKPYTWLEFGSEILMPIPVEEGVNEMWHYGLDSTPQQKAAMRKSFAVTLLMAATGGRIQDDWNKPASPAAAPPWEQYR